MVFAFSNRAFGNNINLILFGFKAKKDASNLQSVNGKSGIGRFNSTIY